MLTFTKMLRQKGRKTDQWSVYLKGYPLGYVRWYSGGRSFCFYPNPGTLFDASCLSELRDFCDTQTREYRA